MGSFDQQCRIELIGWGAQLILEQTDETDPLDVTTCDASNLGLVCAERDCS